LDIKVRIRRSDDKQKVTISYGNAVLRFGHWTVWKQMNRRILTSFTWAFIKFSLKFRKRSWLELALDQIFSLLCSLIYFSQLIILLEFFVWQIFGRKHSVKAVALSCCLLIFLNGSCLLIWIGELLISCKKKSHTCKMVLKVSVTYVLKTEQPFPYIGHNRSSFKY
jgi:hypothetical protein